MPHWTIIFQPIDSDLWKCRGLQVHTDESWKWPILQTWRIDLKQKSHASLTHHGHWCYTWRHYDYTKNLRYGICMAGIGSFSSLIFTAWESQHIGGVPMGTRTPCHWYGGVISFFFLKAKAKMKCWENTLLESKSKFAPEHRLTFHRLSINSQEGYSFALLNDW